MNSSSENPKLAEILDRLSRVEKGITFAAFGVLVVVMFSDVVSRELTGSGLHWARQAGVYANLVIVMFGLGIAAADGAHLRPRFADGWLPARFSPALDRLQDAGMALFCLAFAALAAGVVVDSFGMQERSAVLRIVIWPFQAVIPLAFGLTGLRHAIYACVPALRPRLAAVTDA